MSEFQLTHTALVGARMAEFHRLGFNTRSELTMRRVAPHEDTGTLGQLEPGELRDALRNQLPLWIHNIITDPDFPQRHKLVMPLRRFEGELLDNRSDEVISSVLSHGFRSSPFNPLALPDNMNTRDRCAILAHIQVWQDAFLRLEEEVLGILGQLAESLDRWSDYARHPDNTIVE